ncbi:Holliday junction resolvase RecU [Candidatus Mycoplasma haematominutum]|uniref:Holliday junction resolvase RecU n=1 Tax=Candidatus Mycoplasma haematominutum 'Birmingham 1' TaxID=1116213 RepID=G8C304_9MOLU|nr:Holliday junction resolvase RecU [Candidatus Mycoplasma haematominutum]CCE66702.1 Holliday junction-specific endonuclease [Candidatus Mycoplasma haematominutum 'Birmingham 1']
MKFLSYSNRGSIIEEIMHNTAQYYREHKIAYFRKTNPLYAHLSKKSKHSFGGLLEGEGREMRIKFTYKGDLDYYGLYRGRYFSIELKETQQPTFSLHLIKENQLSQLEEIDHLGGIALVLVHFIHGEKPFWLITYSQLKKLQSCKKTKKFSISEFESVSAVPIEIIYPHILNLEPILKQLMKREKQ